MPLSAGTRLGPYEILAPIGAGGMGEVYRARDTRLGRDVAVKVLAAHLTQSPQARERFQREARAVAALQHPNICTVHDVGETDDGQAYLVMELLQGETLQHRLARGPLELPAIEDVALGLTNALDAAHGAGILHRDIKPANVFLTAHGPKILDFGLAKLEQRSESTPSMQATLQVLTEAGSTMGTVAYMSPEQLRGDELDARTDLFSLGLVLFEMATGKPAFNGATSAVVAAAILHAAPASPRSLRPELPSKLEDVIVKAIEKDRGLRYQHASDIRADLQRLKRGSDATVATTRTADAPAGVATVWKLVGAAAILAVIGVGIYLSTHRTPPLTDKDTIVLADFTNTTGDTVFDETLRQGLTVQLEQSPFLSLIADKQIRDTLRLMGQSPDARLTPALAQDVCERTGSAAVLEGSISAIGTQYVLGLQAKNCATGRLIDSEQLQVPNKEEVLSALSQVASTFRTRVGESLATVEKHSTPLYEATTASLDALKAYSTGRRVNYAEGSAAAIPFFKRAIEIDPNFAIAHSLLGLLYSNVGDASLGNESATTAYRLRDRASDGERFFITAIYDRQVTGNLERAIKTMEVWAQTYPRVADPHGLISGYALAGTGRFERVIEEGEKAIAIDPDHSFGYINAAYGQAYLNRFKEAEAVLDRVSARKLDIPESLLLRYYLAFWKGDVAAMERAVSAARDKPGADEWIFQGQSLVLARAGQARLARAMAQRGIDTAMRGREPEAAAVYKAGVAVWEGLFGNADAARRGAADALALSTGREAQYASAFALALAGDVGRSVTLADDLNTRFPEDTSVQFTYVPTLRAFAALKNGDPQKAIELLKASLPYDVVQTGVAMFGSFGTMYSSYVRGEAYLAARQGAAAAVEFQKLIDHRGLLLGDPLGGVAPLYLGRALAMAGDTAKSRKAYQDFLALWKDADADLPILQQAKQEYAKLP